MTFLFPSALVGVLLLAIPIVVHLFKPRKMRATPFSSLRWLKQTHQRLSRRIQWHQWLLFLMRAGVLLLLVLALAKPILGLGSASSPQDRIILLDTSRSMAYKTPALPSPWETAQDLAGKLLAQQGPGQRTAVLLADSKTRVLSPLVSDVAAVVPLLNEAQPRLADTNLSSALPVLEGLLQNGDKHRPVELVVLTDQQNPSWHQRDIQTLVKKLNRPLKVQVVDVGLGAANNAWIAGTKLITGTSGQERLLVVEVGCVGEQGQSRSVQLAGISGLAEEEQAVILEPGRVSRVGFRLPGELSLAEQIAEIRLVPGDNLANDDTWFLPLDGAGGTRVLLLEPENTGSDGRAVSLFLRAGLEALQRTNKGAVTWQVRTPGSATAVDVRQCDLIVLAGVADLPEAVWSTLETQVRAGTGLVVMPGPNVSANFFNDKLYRALQPSEGLVPLALADDNFLHQPPQPSSLVQLRWQHPLLAPLKDPVLGDWSLGNFSQYLRFKGELGKNDPVLAEFEDGTPALLEHAVGAGRVLLFNTSANDEWTDLPRRQSFVPFLDGVLNYLGRHHMGRLKTVGEAVTLPVEGWPEEGGVQVLSPAGKKWTLPVRKQQDRPMVHLEEVTEAGIYRLESLGSSDHSLRFVVNVGRGDSPLTAMDSQVFQDWWAPVPVEIVTGEEANQRWQAGSSTWPLWPLLVVLVGLLLGMETLYAAWLSPRRNPTLASSVVHDQGLFRPLVEKDA